MLATMFLCCDHSNWLIDMHNGVHCYHCILVKNFSTFSLKNKECIRRRNEISFLKIFLSLSKNMNQGLVKDNECML